MKPVDGDRSIKPLRMKRLSEDIANKNTILFVWAYTVIGMEEVRINGKHSSTLLSQMDSIPSGMTAVVSKYECEDMQDAARLYSQFDGQASSRTQREINRTVQFSSGMGYVSIHSFTACCAGLAAAMNGFNHSSNLTPEDRAALGVANERFIKWYIEIVNTEESKQICQRSPVVAAMYLSWCKSVSDSTKFWTAVRDGSDSIGTPSRVLNKYLLKTTCRVCGRLPGSKLVDDPSKMNVKCIHAWNAFRKNTTTDLKVFAGKRPAVV